MTQHRESQFITLKPAAIFLLEGEKSLENQFDEHWVGGELTQPPPGDQGTNWGPGVTGGKEVSTGQGEGLGVCS